MLETRAISRQPTVWPQLDLHLWVDEHTSDELTSDELSWSPRLT